MLHGLSLRRLFTRKDTAPLRQPGQGILFKVRKNGCEVEQDFTTKGGGQDEEGGSRMPPSRLRRCSREIAVLELRIFHLHVHDLDWNHVVLFRRSYAPDWKATKRSCMTTMGEVQV